LRQFTVNGDSYNFTKRTGQYQIAISINVEWYKQLSINHIEKTIESLKKEMKSNREKYGERWNKWKTLNQGLQSKIGKLQNRLKLLQETQTEREQRAKEEAERTELRKLKREKLKQLKVERKERLKKLTENLEPACFFFLSTDHSIITSIIVSI